MWCLLCYLNLALSSVGLSGLCRSVGLSVDSLTVPARGTCRNSVDLCRTSVDLCRLTMINSVGLCRSSVGLCRDFLSVCRTGAQGRRNRTTVNGGTRSPGTHDTLPGRKVLLTPTRTVYRRRYRSPVRTPVRPAGGPRARSRF